MKPLTLGLIGLGLIGAGAAYLAITKQTPQDLFNDLMDDGLPNGSVSTIGPDGVRVWTPEEIARGEHLKYEAPKVLDAAQAEAQRQILINSGFVPQLTTISKESSTQARNDLISKYYSS